VTSPATGSHSAVPTASSPRLEIYLFDCGHGDTILVKLPDDRWGMIDCYLPKGSVRNRFLAFLAAKNIHTFEFVFQTHPHYDHFHGMEAVLEGLISKGQKIRRYYDHGLNAQIVAHLMNGNPGTPEYVALHKRLEEWADNGSIERWVPLTAERYPVEIPVGGCLINFVPLAPLPDDHRRIVTSDLRKLTAKPTAVAAANALSLVVALTASAGAESFNALLGADAEVDSLAKSLSCWQNHCARYSCRQTFDVIKVPHHGSKHSHHSPVCGTKPAGIAAVAAISAGTREALPDRKVIEAYLNADWTVMCTTTRNRPVSATSLPMTLSSRAAPPIAPPTQTVEFTWEPVLGLGIAPPSSYITTTDLPNYATAKK